MVRCWDRAGRASSASGAGVALPCCGSERGRGQSPRTPAPSPGLARRLLRGSSLGSRFPARGPTGGRGALATLAPHWARGRLPRRGDPLPSPPPAQVRESQRRWGGAPPPPSPRLAGSSWLASPARAASQLLGPASRPVTAHPSPPPRVARQFVFAVAVATGGGGAVPEVIRGAAARAA